MQIIGFVFIAIGSIIGLVYGIRLLILAFQVSVWWGLGYLFVPFVALIFVFVHWDEAGPLFLRGLLAIPFYLVGFLLMPGSSTM